MKIHTLWLQGYRTFSSPVTFNFNRAPGVYNLRGENRLYPELEGNGVGKSSLWDAVCWCLFDKTSRGLSGPALFNWSGEYQLAVSMAFEHRNTQHVVKRTWSSNSLTLNDKSIDQQSLEQVLEFHYDAFLQMCYFAQFSRSFLEIRPADRMELFVEVLGLQQWDEASKESSRLAILAEEQAQEVEKESARVQGKLQVLEAQSAQKEFDEWAAAHAKRIRAASQELEDVRLEQETASGQAEQLQAELASLPDLEKDAEEQRSNLHKFKTAVEWINGRIEQLQQAKGSCSLCGQPLTEAHIKKEIKQLSSTLAGNENGRDSARTRLGTIQHAIKQRQNKETDYRQLKAQTKALERIVQSLVKDLARIEAETNPYASRKKQLSAEIDTLKESQRHLKIELYESKALCEALLFWVKGFKEIRLTIIDRALDQLNLEVNEALWVLGLKGWEIQFEVEQETKSGSVRRGFQCTVSSPTSTKRVPFEAWSGGETQRLKAATDMGLSSLLCARSGIDFSVEFWDEPTRGLSTAGIHDLLEALKVRAEQKKKCIWVSDHHVLGWSGFTERVTLIRTEKGVELE